MDEFLLTMTACVDPHNGSCPLVRSDPKIRLADYEGALRYWLRYPDERTGKILFIENSGYSLETLREIADRENPLRKTVEFVGLDCNWYPPGGNYGYAEMQMLDLGFQQSKLQKLTTHMIKVSGRFRFPSLSKLLDRLPQNFDAAVDSRVWRTIVGRYEHPFVPTQIVLFSHRFYEQHLRHGYRELGKDGMLLIEWLFYEKLIPLLGTPGILLRFPCNVDPVGFPAHRARSYTHPRQKAVYALRGAARRLFPEWWV
jgi:hypothetical protein